jgi:hypothetical protein
VAYGVQKKESRSWKNEELTKSSTDEEIKVALYQMEKKNKAADTDVFPKFFFQKCGNFIKNDIIELFKDLHEKKLDIKRINYDIIMLIPKTKENIKIQ